MKNEGDWDLRARTKRFALQVIGLTQSLARSRVADVIGRQLLRCGTSVGANYRAACRARSKADFASRMSIVLEEADEAQYWMELLIESGTARSEEVNPLLREADQLIAISAASVKTVKGIV